jgi:trk system potassium uptake protein TrkA
MRVVLVGASSVAIATARILLGRHHEVVMVERDKTKIEALAETLDCGFLHGDGSTPAILKEAGPSQTDMLICLTNHDQDNILASLVGRSLGFERIVTKIEDPEFQHICAELALTDTIIPDMNTAATLADLVAGQDATEISSAIRGEARFFSFVARPEDAGGVADLNLPKDASVVLIYRGDDVIFADAETQIAGDDEVVILTHSRNLKKLEKQRHAQPQA